MITLTEKAVIKIKEIAEEDGLDLAIRIKAIGGGCSGIKFDMEFDNSPKELDDVLESGGIKIIVDTISFQYVDGITIDYISSNFIQGFKFIGGEIKSTCGCGSSYSF